MVAKVTAGTVRDIDGDTKSVKQLLKDERYAIDYYQREYKWETKQVEELLQDLATKFRLSFSPEHERRQVHTYGHYFLGSVIVSNKDGKQFIIDGQQRLTTLTLLLLYLYHRHPDPEDQGKLQALIFSRSYGTNSFNIEDKEREPCMCALLAGEPFDDAHSPESVRNIMARYGDIERLFPEETLGGEALPFFVDWLTDNVHLVRISTWSDEDAYTIFETMNDRGLRLAPTDMLKGYLLAAIDDDETRIRCNQRWKLLSETLSDSENEGGMADALKAWLRSQFAKDIRERKRNAKPGDYDRLGTEFHRWVRERAKDIGLRGSDDFARFIERDLTFYAHQYLRFQTAAADPKPGLEAVFYNAQHDFTLQYPLLLAPLSPSDDEATINEKARIVATFLDILLARRLWNFRDISHSTMQYAMFQVMRSIRGLGLDDLREELKRRLEEQEERFAVDPQYPFGLHQQNGTRITQFLARMTDFVERESGLPSHFVDYVTGTGKKKFEIEHIWADKYERHTDEFASEADFKNARNLIGGLLLLQKSFNASYGDLAYGEKLQHYAKENLLARSLHPICYSHNPGFVAFVRNTGLPFRDVPEFKKAQMLERQELYRRLAERLWSPARLDGEQGNER